MKSLVSQRPIKKTFVPCSGVDSQEARSYDGCGISSSKVADQQVQKPESVKTVLNSTLNGLKVMKHSFTKTVHCILSDLL